MGENPIIGAYRIENLRDNGETLLLNPGKFTKEPMLFFEFDNTCIVSVNDSTYYGKYDSKAGKLNISMKDDPKIFRAITGNFNENKFKGISEKKDRIEFGLKKMISDQVPSR